MNAYPYIFLEQKGQTGWQGSHHVLKLIFQVLLLYPLPTWGCGELSRGQGKLVPCPLVICLDLLVIATLYIICNLKNHKFWLTARLFNMHMESKYIIFLPFIITIILFANREGSGKTAWMYRLARKPSLFANVLSALYTLTGWKMCLFTVGSIKSKAMQPL